MRKCAAACQDGDTTAIVLGITLIGLETEVPTTPVTEYENAILAVGDVLRLYLPTPDLATESIELQQAVENAVVVGARERIGLETIIDDLSAVTHRLLADDAIAAAVVTHKVTGWAKAKAFPKDDRPRRDGGNGPADMLRE